MERQSDGTGRPGLGSARTATPKRLFAAGRIVLGAGLAVVGCTTLWPATRVSTQASPSDAFGCLVTQAKQLGFRVAPDSGHHQLQAEQALPQAAHGADLTEYARKNVLVAKVVRTGGGTGAGGGSTIDVRAETIAQEETRRGLTDESLPASPEVRAAADTLVARCRSAPPTTSLPG